jgi:hypothetical protein
MDIQSRLNNVLAKDENKICADCNAKNPRWVSTSLGVVICIRCCGHHRSLGTHISKVKSVTLDKWNNDMIIIFERLNNNIVNQYWERNKPTSVAKPVESSSSYTVESYIRDKYQRKLWAPRDEVDPVTRVLSPAPPQSMPARTETPQTKAPANPVRTQHIDLFADAPRISPVQSQAPPTQSVVPKAQPITFPPAPTFPSATLIQMPDFPQASFSNQLAAQQAQQAAQQTAQQQANREEEERKRKIDQLMMMYQQSAVPQAVQPPAPTSFQPLGAIAAQNLIQGRVPQPSYPSPYLNPGQWPSF